MKDKFIGVRIDQDMFIVLQAFKLSKGWNYSDTIRIALEHYSEYIMQQEDAGVKQQAK